MKVICIDGVKEGTIGVFKIITAHKIDEIYEGEIYTVVATEKIRGIVVYGLEERPTTYYRAERFLPVSDISEKEFERDYNKDLA